jgi:signal transduction histidine kinase
MTTIVADLTVGSLFLAGGAFLWRRRPGDRMWLLMLATAAAWIVGGVLHRGPLTHLLLGAPSGRLGNRLSIAFLAFAYVDGAVESVTGIPLASVVWAAGLAVLATARIAQSTGPVRRQRLVPSVAAVTIAAILVSGTVADLANARASDLTLALYELALAVTAIGLTVDAAWGAWSQQALTGLVVELGDRDAAGTLRDRLADALGDRSLQLGYWAPAADRYVDDEGAGLELPGTGSSRRVTTIDSDGQPIAVLVHDAAVLDDPRLVEAVAAAARISVDNARLQADIVARIVEIEASRRRLAESAGRQRQRVGREIVAGPVASLGRVRSLLGRFDTPDTDVAADVAEARRQLDGAVEELEGFARGLDPSGLLPDGLARSLDDLAARTPVPVAVHTDHLPPLSRDVETAAWFLCSEALANVTKHAQATRAEIRAEVRRGSLRVTVTDDGIGGADEGGAGIRGLVDRIQAIGGELKVVSTVGGGTTLEAQIPLAGPLSLPSDGAA